MINISIVISDYPLMALNLRSLDCKQVTVCNSLACLRLYQLIHIMDVILILNKHKVICEQRLNINLCTQMKTILTGLPMYGYWPGSVFMYVRGIEVCVCAHVCACGVCVRVVCVCVVRACVWCVCACGVCVRVVWVCACVCARVVCVRVVCVRVVCVLVLCV